jgi:hypothetical protein
MQYPRSHAGRAVSRLLDIKELGNIYKDIKIGKSIIWKIHQWGSLDVVEEKA